MIWRSRSLSARSSKSIVFSRPGSSGRAGAGGVTNRLDHALQALAIVLLNCTTFFVSLARLVQWSGAARERGANRALRANFSTNTPTDEGDVPALASVTV